MEILRPNVQPFHHPGFLSRRLLGASAVLLIIAVAGFFIGIQGQAGSPRTWLEFEARPSSMCYQGAPRREVVHWQLGSGGPALRLFEERQIRLPLRLEAGHAP